MTELRRLTLHDRHADQNARFASFAGFEMPMQYSGIVNEHTAVREAVGIFDVSHMGAFTLIGSDAVTAIDRLVTNDISGLAIGKAAYTVMCREDGGIIDDLIVYKRAANNVLIVVNASRRTVDLAHMQEELSGDAILTDRSDDYTLLALQGPRAASLLDELVDIDLAGVQTYAGVDAKLDHHPVFIGRTGYTGEDGFEILIENHNAVPVFDRIMAAGTRHGLKPCGLGARDTLRLEARYPLYGNDLTLDTNPLEAGLAWVVKLDKVVSFVGQEALRRIRGNVTRRLRAVAMDVRGVLRGGYRLYVDDRHIGTLTSGSMSPTLGYSVGIAYIDIEFAGWETGVQVEIRGRRLPVRLSRRAFWRRPG